MYAHNVPIENAPIWLNALIACEQWSCPPWEVLPNYANRRWWFMAYNLVAGEKNRAMAHVQNKYK